MCFENRMRRQRFFPTFSITKRNSMRVFARTSNMHKWLSSLVSCRKKEWNQNKSIQFLTIYLFKSVSNSEKIVSKTLFYIKLPFNYWKVSINKKCSFRWTGFSYCQFQSNTWKACKNSNYPPIRMVCFITYFMWMFRRHSQYRNSVLSKHTAFFPAFPFCLCKFHVQCVQWMLR